MTRGRYQRLRDQGRCVWCSEPAIPGYARCEVCHSKGGEWYQQQRAAGRCIRCGGPSERFMECLPCRKARVGVEMATYRELKARGKCVACRKDAGGHTRCEQCRRRARELRAKNGEVHA